MHIVYSLEYPSIYNVSKKIITTRMILSFLPSEYTRKLNKSSVVSEFKNKYKHYYTEMWNGCEDINAM